MEDDMTRNEVTCLILMYGIATILALAYFGLAA